MNHQSYILLTVSTKLISGYSPVQQQIHKMLGEVLGGINYVQTAVVTPYFYTVGG